MALAIGPAQGSIELRGQRRLLGRERFDEALAGGRIRCLGYCLVACGEELLLLQLDSLPRRIAEHGGEAPRPSAGRVGPGCVVDPEYLRELQVPVEEPVVDRLALNGGDHSRIDVPWVVLQRLEGRVSDGRIALPLGLHECGAPRIGDLPSSCVIGIVLQIAESLSLLVCIGQGGRRSRVDLRHLRGEVGIGGMEATGREELALVGLLALGPVALLQARGPRLVVAGEGDERGIGQTLLEQPGRHSEQGIADLDMGIEERQRPALLHRLEPQAHLRELGCHRVEVDAVDAPGDDIVQCFVHVGRSRVELAGSHRCEPARDPPRRRDEKVPGAAGRVADGHGEQRLLGVLLLLRLVEKRVEGLVEHEVDEARGRVVGAGCLAVIAGEVLEGEDAAQPVVPGNELEQALVDAAELLSTEVSVVDDARWGVLRLNHAEPPDRREQRLIRQSLADHHVDRLMIEDPAEARQAQLRQAALIAEPGDDKLQALPEVGMAGTAALACEGAQTAGREVVAIALERDLIGRRILEQAPVLGDEQEEQTVDEAKQRAVIVLEPQLTIRDAHAEVIARALQEPGAQGLDGILHAVSEQAKRAGARLGSTRAPPLEPAIGRHSPLGHFDPRLMKHHEHQGEVAEHLAVEHALEIELDVRLSGQAGGVAQEPQGAAVAEHCPEVVMVAVEELLEHRLRCAIGRAGHALRPAVELDTPPEQVEGCCAPQVGDRKRLVVGVQPACRRLLQPAIAELLEQDGQPSLPRHAHCWIALGQFRESLPVGRPRSEEVAPRPVRSLLRRLARGQVVVAWCQPAQILIAAEDAPQQVRWQQPADDSDAGEVSGTHWVPPATGRNTYAPRMSGGFWAVTFSPRRAAPAPARARR
ncbi:unannotated protein [freshwater metagenome]|uniref:Unannotated protein n=1 Tax=freshwater metagenome TaxID=449393 RepID=A0A6J7EFW9_9ZZZZ